MSVQSWFVVQILTQVPVGMIGTCAPSLVPSRGVVLDEISGVILSLCAYVIYTPLRFFFSLERLLKPGV